MPNIFLNTSHGILALFAGAMVSRRDMGDTRGGTSVVSGINAVRDELHMETADSRSTVGTVKDNIRSVLR